MNTITMEYELEGVGWARLALEAGDDRIEIGRLSHAGEPLREMLWAALAAALGRSAPDIALDHERWRTGLAFSPDQDDLFLSATERWWIEDQAFSQSLGQVRAEPEAFAAAVRDCAAGLLSRHGVEAYDDQWRALGFPARALAALTAALAIDDPAGARDG